jgi:hypothetical protein
MRKSSKMWITVTVFALLLGLQPAARADAVAYMDTRTDQFGTIDLNTGVFTQIGKMGQQLSGLGVSGGNLFGGVTGTGNLYQVNPSSGALTLVGAGPINYLDTGSTSGGLYALGGPGTVGSALSLYSINATTGAAALIGATGLSFSTTVVDTVGLSTGSGSLYLTFGPSFSTATLYSVNVTTGTATSIGNTGADALGAEVFEGGALYGGSNTNGVSPVDSVYTLNTTTGAGTFIASESGGATQFYGLAPASPAAVPEPGSLLLLLTGLAAIVSRALGQTISRGRECERPSAFEPPNSR